MAWRIVQSGRVLCQHDSKRMCVIEAFERGFVQRPSRRDFVEDEPMPDLMLAPGVSIEHWKESAS